MKPSVAQKRWEGSQLSVHRFTFLSVTCGKFTLILFLQCLNVVREAFAAVEAALTSGNTSQLAVDFGCCQTPRDPVDQVMTVVFIKCLGRNLVSLNKGKKSITPFDFWFHVSVKKCFIILMRSGLKQLCQTNDLCWSSCYIILFIIILLGCFGLNASW